MAKMPARNTRALWLHILFGLNKCRLCLDNKTDIRLNLNKPVVDYVTMHFMCGLSIEFIPNVCGLLAHLKVTQDLSIDCVSLQILNSIKNNNFYK